MLKTRMTLAATALALLSLTGCATQAQLDEQNKQLAAINVSLTQIQAAQAESLAQQKVQTSVLVETHNLQAAEAAQQLKRK
jgi:murein lipoprotein